jgi:hypothetical protein
MTTSQKTSRAELSRRLPGPRTAKWPEGERFVQGLARGSMVVELFAPIGHDPHQHRGGRRCASPLRTAYAAARAAQRGRRDAGSMNRN